MHQAMTSGLHGQRRKDDSQNSIKNVRCKMVSQFNFSPLDLNALAPVIIGTCGVGGQGLFQRGGCSPTQVVHCHGGALLTLGDVSPGANGWQQVDHKREDVTGEDKGNDPFEDG